MRVSYNSITTDFTDVTLVSEDTNEDENCEDDLTLVIKFASDLLTSQKHLSNYSSPEPYSPRTKEIVFSV